MTSQNQVILEGEPTAMPVWSHENHGIRFYRFLLRVPRLSGQQDLLPVLTPESNLNAFTAAWGARTLCPEKTDYAFCPGGKDSARYPEQSADFPETSAGRNAHSPEVYPERVSFAPETSSLTFTAETSPAKFAPETSPLSFSPETPPLTFNTETSPLMFNTEMSPLMFNTETHPLTFDSETPPVTFAPEMIRISGQFRSFNNRTGTGSRLILSVYAQQFQSGTGTPCNQILLSGTLCKPPSLRRTPLGRSICDLMLAVPRHYGRADYLPVIAWGQLAIQTSEMHVGDTLELEGRVQSRIYHKVTPDGVEQRTAYEISMMHRL